jgi:predicted alpha/beta-hydrolase family hydrolase
MLPSLGVRWRTGHGACGPRGTGLEYQHATPGATVAVVLRIYLGHGAAGGALTMQPWVDGLRARGFEAFALTLPRRRAEDAVAAFEAQVPDEPGIVVGGHSFGGRVASLSAAGVGHGDGGDLPGPARSYAALVCLSYPLHRPGHPETAGPRTAHWPRVACPALLLSGTRDPFATLALLEAAMPALPEGRLMTYPGLGHGLLPERDAVLDEIAGFLRGLEAGRQGLGAGL